MIQLFLSLQSHSVADIVEFFHFENQCEPPTLTVIGMLHSRHKSDILSCIWAPTFRSPAAWDVSMMVSMGKQLYTWSITFKDYVLQHIVSFLQGQISVAVNYIYVVWDVYPDI